MFAPELQAIRPHPGQALSAANLVALLADSGVVASHRGPDCNRVQDAYSLRCSPQVHGAARDTVEHAATVAGRELASAVDNPVVLAEEGRVESNGNFHGAPVGYVLDFLAIVAADVASISERRTDRFLDKARNHGLPPFLAGDPGVDSGHMIAQYTQAAIVSELKRLAVPASVDSIPSSAMQEDHVSMGWSAARKLRRSVDGLTRVIAVEVLTAARALDLRAPLEPSPATAAVVRLLREQRRRGTRPRPPPLARDRDRRSAGRVRRRPQRGRGRHRGPRLIEAPDGWSVQRLQDASRRDVADAVGVDHRGPEVQSTQIRAWNASSSRRSAACSSGTARWDGISHSLVRLAEGLADHLDRRAGGAAVPAHVVGVGRVRDQRRPGACRRRRRGIAVEIRRPGSPGMGARSPTSRLSRQHWMRESVCAAWTAANRRAVSDSDIG